MREDPDVLEGDERAERADHALLGRNAFAARAWTAAFEAFRAAGPNAPLTAEDLAAFAVAAYLIGRDDDAVDAWGRAHRAALDAGDPVGAARQAFSLGMMLVQRGDMAVGGGWLGRAGRLVEESGIDSVERGYLLIPQGRGRLEAGDPAGAYETFGRAAEIAERFADPDLATMARLGRGRSLIDQGDIAPGVALLDEAMIAATTNEVSPITVGIVYCASIEAFQGIFDLRRAHEWTDSLTAWCASQPDLVPFRGRCLVYRAEVMRLRGAWSEAIDEARRAEAVLLRPPPETAVGEALYEQAELHRLRGRFTDAENAYREANRWGRAPEPGLALLRLEQGRPDAAMTVIHRALDETTDPMKRARLLEPAVDIALAARDQVTARSAAAELAEIAAGSTAPVLAAMAARAEGILLLAGGNARAGLAALRRAATIWRDLEAPYEVARVLASIGVALRALGDVETADLESAEARRIFVELGATPDVARLDASIGYTGDAGDHAASGVRADGLSPREVEVLRLVAAGGTNRAIAEELGISERTVDRHVSNIFTKLDVGSRAAATAYAYEHGIR